MKTKLPWKTRRLLKRQQKEFSRLISPTRKISSSKLFAELTEKEIRNDPEIFDKEFFKDVASRRFELEKSFWSVWFVTFLIGSFLTSRLVGGAEFSLLGLTLKSSTGAREPLLFLLGVASILVTIQKHQIDRMTSVLEAGIKAKINRRSGVYKFRYAEYLPTDLYIANSDGTTGDTLFSLSFRLMFVFLFISICSIVILLMGFVGFLNAYDVYKNPSYEHYISYGAVVFYILTWIFAVTLNVVDKYPFRVRDYTKINELMKLKEEDPTAHQAAIDELSYRASIAAGLVRK